MEPQAPGGGNIVTTKSTALRYPWLIALLLWLAIGTAPAQDAAAADSTAERARSHLQADRPIQAWRSLIEMDALDDTAFERHRDLINEVSRVLNDSMNRNREAQRPGPVIEAGELLQTAESLALVSKVFPQFLDNYNEAVRLNLGTAHWQQGNSESNRGRRDEAEASYRRALLFLQPGDELYGRANLTLAQAIFERANRLLGQQRPNEAAPLWQQAMDAFVEARDHSQPGDQINTEARLLISGLVSTGMAFTNDIIPPPPTPIPTPTPTPGMFERVFGPSIANSVSDYVHRLRTDSQTQSQFLSWAGIIIGIFMIYWVIPLFVLGKMEDRGDLTAHEWKNKARYLGIFALIAYFAVSFTGFRGSSGKETGGKGAGEKCPSCNKPIDNMFSYDDLVFSRCPSCKNKIVPIFTVEEYVKTLANGITADSEKVNTGAMSLENHIKADAVVRLVKAIVTLGVRRRASDLHFEPDDSGLIIRQRVDGIMTEMFNLPRALSLSLVSAIKVNANMDISEKRVPQDGKFQMYIDSTNIDIRVASSPTSLGEKVTLRVLDIRSIQMTPEHLGMRPDAKEVFERVIHQPHGMALITGPTGSGKTTTIYVAIQQLCGGDKNIVSIEDPIEFRIQGVNQIQVNPVAGLTFAAGLRSILRQDPDVIVVGEIRDKETAEISVNSVQTGHLVLSTLHTVDASSSVARLLDFGVSPRQFADALSLVVAQRLVRLVCQYCQQPTEPPDSALRELGLTPPLKGFDFQIGAGCQVCGNTGYFRRTGIFELLQPSERLRIELENGSLSTGQIREIAVQGGMKTLRHEALMLLKTGRTTVDETLRITK